MLALATHFDWEVEQMDVKTAFLYPEIEEEVYIKMPEGYKRFFLKDQNAEGITRLLKTLYGPSAKKSFAPSVIRLRPDLDRRKFYALGTYDTL